MTIRAAVARWWDGFLTTAAELNGRQPEPNRAGLSPATPTQEPCTPTAVPGPGFATTAPTSHPRSTASTGHLGAGHYPSHPPSRRGSRS